MFISAKEVLKSAHINPLVDKHDSRQSVDMWLRLPSAADSDSDANSEQGYCSDEHHRIARVQDDTHQSIPTSRRLSPEERRLTMCARRVLNKKSTWKSLLRELEIFYQREQQVIYLGILAEEFFRDIIPKRWYNDTKLDIIFKNHDKPFPRPVVVKVVRDQMAVSDRGHFGPNKHKRELHEGMDEAAQTSTTTAPIISEPVEQAIKKPPVRMQDPLHVDHVIISVPVVKLDSTQSVEPDVFNDEGALMQAFHKPATPEPTKPLPAQIIEVSSTEAMELGPEKALLVSKNIEPLQVTPIPASLQATQVAPVIPTQAIHNAHARMIKALSTEAMASGKPAIAVCPSNPETTLPAQMIKASSTEAMAHGKPAITVCPSSMPDHAQQVVEKPSVPKSPLVESTNTEPAQVAPTPALIDPVLDAPSLEPMLKAADAESTHTPPAIITQVTHMPATPDRKSNPETTLPAQMIKASSTEAMAHGKPAITVCPSSMPDHAQQVVEKPSMPKSPLVESTNTEPAQVAPTPALIDPVLDAPSLEPMLKAADAESTHAPLVVKMQARAIEGSSTHAMETREAREPHPEKSTVNTSYSDSTKVEDLIFVPTPELSDPRVPLTASQNPCGSESLSAEVERNIPTSEPAYVPKPTTMEPDSTPKPPTQEVKVHNVENKKKPNPSLVEMMPHHSNEQVSIPESIKVEPAVIAPPPTPTVGMKEAQVSPSPTKEMPVIASLASPQKTAFAPDHPDIRVSKLINPAETPSSPSKARSFWLAMDAKVSANNSTGVHPKTEAKVFESYNSKNVLTSPADSEVRDISNGTNIGTKGTEQSKSGECSYSKHSSIQSLLYTMDVYRNTKSTKIDNIHDLTSIIVREFGKSVTLVPVSKLSKMILKDENAYLRSSKSAFDVFEVTQQTVAGKISAMWNLSIAQSLPTLDLEQLNAVINREQCLCATLFRLVYAQASIVGRKYATSSRKMTRLRILRAKAMANVGKILAPLVNYSDSRNDDYAVDVLDSFECAADTLSELQAKQEHCTYGFEIKMRVYSVRLLLACEMKKTELKYSLQQRTLHHVLRILLLLKNINSRLVLDMGHTEKGRNAHEQNEAFINSMERSVTILSTQSQFDVVETTEVNIDGVSFVAVEIVKTKSTCDASFRSQEHSERHAVGQALHSTNGVPKNL